MKQIRVYMPLDFTMEVEDEATSNEIFEAVFDRAVDELGVNLVFAPIEEDDID